MYLKVSIVFLCFSMVNFVLGKPALSSMFVIQNGNTTKLDQEVNNVETDEPILDINKLPVNTANYTITEDGLFQGDCNSSSRKPLIYTENFILENDNKSQVVAAMEIRHSDRANITCVEISDRSNSTEDPKILRGGIGSSFVEVAVSPGYGKGFDFSVRLYGFYH
ncbi:uncharacterized protein LOC143915505 [Arctopsyche grandis]|uniref:uncharacterized protein LOC143915505 n=1 Tax=Arctopsyche grandis TaxID=121162 RepID=UPI00406D7C13